MAEPDPAPLLNQIEAWAKTNWPSVYDPELAASDAWLGGRRTGREIVHSMLFDIGLAMGEVVVARRPQYRWALNLDPVDEADEMQSWRRPVVQIPAGGSFPAPIIFDFEAKANSRYRYVNSYTYGISHPLSRSPLEAISGAYEDLLAPASREGMSRRRRSPDGAECNPGLGGVLRSAALRAGYDRSPASFNSGNTRSMKNGSSSV